MEPVILTENLTKFYGEKCALKDLNLEVKAGEVFGFLGPNGAGKTTTIRLFFDFIRPTRGRAQILGKDAQRESTSIKKEVTYLPSEFGLFSHLTIGELLDYFSRFAPQTKARDNIESLTKRFQLDEGKKVRSLSHGMRQKTAIVMAFMKEPELLVLDEPTQGLDPLMQEEFYKLVREFRDRGKTIFLSSHVLREVEKVCDRCGIIKEGELVEVETVAKLTERKFKRVEVVFAEETPVEKLSKLPGISEVKTENGRFQAYLQDHFEEFLREVHQYPLRDLNIQNPSLEEIFLKYYE